MTIETIRRCDHCGFTPAAKEELWTIGVVAVLNANSTSPFPHQFNRGAKGAPNNRLLKDHWMDMCRPCMTERGLIVAPNEEPAKEPETLDSLLREIVAEEVSDAMDEGGR